MKPTNGRYVLQHLCCYCHETIGPVGGFKTVDTFPPGTTMAMPPMPKAYQFCHKKCLADEQLLAKVAGAVK